MLGAAAAEEVPAVPQADLSGLEDFAWEYADGLGARELAEAAAGGNTDFDALLNWLRMKAADPVGEVLGYAGSMLAPVLMLALLGCVNSVGTRLPLRLTLLSVMLRTASVSLNAAADCLEMTARFADAAVPAMSALMTASGMTNSAALLSPASAMAGNLAQEVFQKWGLRLCRLALCVAAAGGMSPAFDPGRAGKIIKRIVGWGTGLCFTLFTALIALQGNMASALDGVAMRTAKFAVDSASGIMGSGVSDVWDSYVSGMRVTCGSVGFSGAVLLLAAGFRPLLRLGATMLLLHVIGVLLDMLGEATTARAAQRMGDAVQMALELCSGALAIAGILLGAGMAAGRGVLA